MSLAAGLAAATQTAGTPSQEPAAGVATDRLVGTAPAGMMLLEPHLAAHPTDAGHLVAVGYETTGDYGRGYCVVFASHDAGVSWSRTRLPGDECPDAWVTLTEERALVTALGDHAALPIDRSQLIAYFSDDRAATWSPVPQSLGSGFDGPRSVAGLDGTLYVTAGQAWRGRTGAPRAGVFVGLVTPSTPHVFARARILPSNLNQVADGVAVLSDGALLVTYQDFQRPVGGPERAFRGRAGALTTRRQWAMVSTDEGETFSPPMLVTESCWGRPTFLAIDPSGGPTRDHLYLVCAGNESRSVVLTSSASRGEEWTDATPVEAPSERALSRLYPQVAVNRDGVVAVAWMDRRDDPSGSCYAPYVTTSIDGGVTHAAPVRLASAISCPDLESLGRAGGRFPTGGDYFGLAAAADGRFHVLWPDAREGAFALRTTTVAVGDTHP